METMLRTLAEWSLRATVLAAIAFALLWLSRKRSVSLHLAVWTAVLAGALLIPMVAWLAPQIPIPALGRASFNSADAGAISIPPAPLPVRKSSRDATLRWPAIATAIWLTVTAAMLLRLFQGWRLTRRLVRASREIEPGVRESSAATVPVAIGIFNPVILLPPDWREWEPSKLQAVLAHERSHISRRDPARQMAASIYRCLCWFHPLAWWLYAHLAALAEAASDDAALAAVGDETVYAETLFSFLGRAPQRVRWEGVAMARNGKVTKRMERILDSHRALSGPLTRGAIAVLALAALPAIYVAASARLVVAQEAAAPKNDPYSKWLREDVAYIIKVDERAAFQRLETDDERRQFIDQFWERRNPTPGARENPFRQEHYRRIAYANERFAADIAGWKTDRGRIYIQYGPPDEIESHPSSSNGATPYELWLYRYIEGVGANVVIRFVDSSGNGEYHMALDPHPGQARLVIRKR